MADTIVISDLAESTPYLVGGIPVIAIDTPVIFEDEGQEEMGDSAPHSTTIGILLQGIMDHLADQPRLRVYTDLNVLYHPIKRGAYFSADVMVVEPFQPLPEEDFSSYRIGEDGPAPLLTIEVLSKRTAQQGDLTSKPKIYSDSEIPEYLLVDTTGKFLKQRLQMLRRQPDGSWLESRDADGGVTSALGFRVIIEEDGNVCVMNAKSGRKYIPPNRADRALMEAMLRTAAAEEAKLRAEREKQHAEQEKKRAEEHAKQLEAEIVRLRRLLPPDTKD